jgi:CDP-6-deoxy-D-xylo-4-hexulose-3-dehydrase
MDTNLQKILDDVKSYIEEKHKNRKWTPGADWVQYAGPYFGSEEYIRSIKSLLNEWLVLGSEAIEFEKLFPKLFGKNFGVVTNSGSSANLLMIAALSSKRWVNFPKGSGIITPVAGFPTTVNPILQCGFVPVFIDIELDTLNIDLESTSKGLYLTKDDNIRGMMFAHVLGNPPDMDRVMDLVKTYKLTLLEDCCDALGSVYDDKPLGSFGDMASCSFYPAHHITMGEGGFVSCKNEELEQIVRSFREWGRGCYCVGKKANLSKCGSCGKRFDNWLPSMPHAVFDHKYVYEEIGYNLKPIELQCSMGLEQLKRLPEIREKRISNYQRLFDIFSKYEEYFILPRATKKSSPSWFAFPLTIKTGAPFNRHQIRDFLEDNKIQTRNYFGGNLLLQPAYSHMLNGRDAQRFFPNATKATTDTFFLGTSPVITLEQLNYVEEIVDQFMKTI